MKFPVILKKKKSSVSWHFSPPPFKSRIPSLQFFSNSTLLHYVYSQCNTEVTFSKYVRSGLYSAVILPGVPISCRKSQNQVLIVSPPGSVQTRPPLTFVSSTFLMLPIHSSLYCHTGPLSVPQTRWMLLHFRAFALTGHLPRMLLFPQIPP